MYLYRRKSNRYVYINKQVKINLSHHDWNACNKNALEYNCDMNLYISNQSHDYIWLKQKCSCRNVKNLVAVLKILDRGQIGQAIKSDGGEVLHFNHESKGIGSIYNGWGNNGGKRFKLWLSLYSLSCFFITFFWGGEGQAPQAPFLSNKNW